MILFNRWRARVEPGPGGYTRTPSTLGTPTDSFRASFRGDRFRRRRVRTAPAGRAAPRPRSTSHRPSGRWRPPPGRSWPPPPAGRPARRATSSRIRSSAIWPGALNSTRTPRGVGRLAAAPTGAAVPSKATVTSTPVRAASAAERGHQPAALIGQRQRRRNRSWSRCSRPRSGARAAPSSSRSSSGRRPCDGRAAGRAARRRPTSVGRPSCRARCRSSSRRSPVAAAVDGLQQHPEPGVVDVPVGSRGCAGSASRPRFQLGDPGPRPGAARPPRRASSRSSSARSRPAASASCSSSRRAARSSAWPVAQPAAQLGHCSACSARRSGGGPGLVRGPGSAPRTWLGQPGQLGPQPVQLGVGLALRPAPASCSAMSASRSRPARRPEQVGDHRDVHRIGGGRRAAGADLADQLRRALGHRLGHRVPEAGRPPPAPRRSRPRPAAPAWPARTGRTAAATPGSSATGVRPISSAAMLDQLLAHRGRQHRSPDSRSPAAPSSDTSRSDLARSAHGRRVSSDPDASVARRDADEPRTAQPGRAGRAAAAPPRSSSSTWRRPAGRRRPTRSPRSARSRSAAARCSASSRPWSTRGSPIAPFVSVLTGITDAMVAPAPDASTRCCRRSWSSPRGSVLVAHNAPFDVGFLQGGLRRSRAGPGRGFAVVDTALLARRVLTRDEVPNCKLGTLAGVLPRRAPCRPTARWPTPGPPSTCCTA